MKQILLIGSSGGIGNKTTQTLLDHGYQVIGTYFQHPENVENLKDNHNFSSYQLDIKNPESVEELLKTTSEDLYAVINCSGICKFESNNISEDLKIWQESVNTNLSGNYFLAKYFYQRIEENGRFIMISSTDSYFGGAITASYAASKAGVNSLTKSLSLLFQDKKIRVNSIAPGWVITPMIKSNGNEFLEKVADINPLKRNGLPEDIANLIKFLLSEEANYINGQVISIEGGYTNQDPTLLLEEDVQS